jgi:hypothetical protein
VTKRKRKSAIVTFAQEELKLLDDGSEMQKEMNKCVIDVLQVIAGQGHSGFSVSYMMNVINTLVDLKPLTPLTGKDDEWVEVAQDLFQNKRCPAVFKSSKRGAYYLYGKVFTDKTGASYTNTKSAVKIKFPYTPKTVYIHE